MKEVGKFLKKEREKQGLSLEDLADRTKIHIQRLVDIEDGNRASLPAKVFCVGLIKSYGRELKVDMDQLSQLVDSAFQEILPVPDPSPIPTEPLVIKEKKKVKKKASAKTPVKTATPNEDENQQVVGRFKVPKIIMIMGSGLLSVFLIFVIFGIVEKMNAYQKEEALPKEVFTTEPSSLENSENPATQENSTSESPVNEDPQKTEKDPISEPVVAKTSTSVDTKAVDVKPAPEEPPQITETKVDKVNLDEDFSDDNFDISSEANTQVVSDNKITITALEPVRAEVVWSDGYVQVMLLKSKETKTLVFSQPITLKVNNGGAIQVSFNDSENKVPGTFNQPIEIQYP